MTGPGSYADTIGPDHHAEMETHYASGQHRANAQHAAEIVCHEEQMTIWTDEIIGHLSMGGYLKDGLTYEAVLTIRTDISRELKSIIENAFMHPALAEMEQSAGGHAAVKREL